MSIKDEVFRSTVKKTFNDYFVITMIFTGQEKCI